MRIIVSVFSIFSLDASRDLGIAFRDLFFSWLIRHAATNKLWVVFETNISRQEEWYYLYIFSSILSGVVSVECNELTAVNVPYRNRRIFLYCYTKYRFARFTRSVRDWNKGIEGSRTRDEKSSYGIFSIPPACSVSLEFWDALTD